MNEKRKLRPIATWAIVFAAIAALLSGAVFAARPMLDDEAAQARTLVEQGQRALGQGDRGAAVLALERARWLAPRAPFVRTAIAAAEIHDAETLLPRTLRLVTSKEWSAIAIILGWTSGLALAFAIAKRGTRTAGKVALAAGAGLTAAMVALFAASDTAPAVVTTAGTRALIAPYADAAASGPLPAGTVVVRGPEHAGFVRVRSGEGVEGWMPQTSAAPIARLEE
ncbi:MAG: hypothetical protein JWO86_6610 [Myxococcaceae bacterium]|jgi:hypothetical protein|nr:hypothetical protein [Myxococcaceae bacterium]MEA2747926.1 hypothetical protein [Myxococcales bacterium]